MDAVVIQRKADQQRVDADEPLEIRNDRDRAPAPDQNRLFAPFLGERGSRLGKLRQPPIQRDRGRAGELGASPDPGAQDLRAKLTESMETPTDKRRWRVAICGPQRPAQVELGPEFRITWDPKGADFALSLGEFYCSQLTEPVLVEVQREGVVYARVYDIRGRTVTRVNIPQ